MVATRLNLGEFNIASVDRFQVTITKDGLAWDLSDATITFIFEMPDRLTQFTRTALFRTPGDGSDGIFYYDSTVTDFLVTGWWTLGVHVVDHGGVTKTWPHEIGFHMVDQP